MKTLIQNGQIITATDNYRADIFIDGETITTIGKKLDMEADVTIDAASKYVIPGGHHPHAYGASFRRHHCVG
jgi:dihydropyrimidinase